MFWVSSDILKEKTARVINESLEFQLIELRVSASKHMSPHVMQFMQIESASERDKKMST